MSDERLATLEAQRISDQTTLQRVSEQLDEVAQDVSVIKLRLENQKGFLSGVMFILLPIWSAVTAAGIWLADKWMDQGQ